MAHPPPHHFARPNPVTATFVAFPTACFTLALLADLAYWQSGGEPTWQHFAEWLLFAGCVGGGLASLAGIIELLGRPRVRHRPGVGAEVVLFVAALVLATVNSFVHARDGWTAVVPLGLGLSAATVAAMLLAGLSGCLARGRAAPEVRHA